MSDLISRQAAIDALCSECQGRCIPCKSYPCSEVEVINALPPAEPEYEELTVEEAASEIASGSLMSAWYWLDAMTRLEQMGYVICRKK